MRIAFLAQPFDNMSPPVRGGSLSLWVYYMAKFCARQGHEAVVFGNHGGALSARETSCEGVRYIFTPTGLDRFWNKVASRYPRKSERGAAIPWFGAAAHHQQYAKEAARRARALDCDVVHIMNYSQFAPIVRKFHPNARIALHMQCEWLTQLDRAEIESRLEQTDTIIGCSKYITRTVAAAFPRFAGKCATVPNATDIVEAGAGPMGSQDVLFVGRLSPEKGIHDLIRAFHQVLNRFPEARLHLVGGAGSAPVEYMVGISNDPRVTALKVFYSRPGNGAKDPYLEILEEEAGEELGKRIHFVGRVNHDQIQEHYRQAAVLVNPSLSESFGISLVEAMIRKIPVVATSIGGMTYTVDHGVTGLLVEPADPGALANAICQVLGDPEMGKRMGAAGREKAVAQFSWDRTGELFLECLQGDAVLHSV